MKKKIKFDPKLWFWEQREVPYNTYKETPATFIEKINKACEGLTHLRLEITGHGGDEFEGTSSWVDVVVSGARPKTQEELEREQEVMRAERERQARDATTQRERELAEARRLYKKYKPILTKDD